MEKKLLIVTIFLLTLSITYSQDLTPYFEIGEFEESIESSVETVQNALKENEFRIIGTYHPENLKNLAVVCYTRPDIEKIALNFPDRGALAAALKIGFKKEGDFVEISMLNPLYLFNAYFGENIEKHENELKKITEEVMQAMKIGGTDFTAFGGVLSAQKLQKYHYKIMMPYFEDAEELNQFDSFEEGLKIIQNKLAANSGDTQKVYELIYPEKQVAVFGVALLNEEDGEPNFLPIIGERHVAAMPYELILQGKTASILPGKYRIALHWPELSMGTFMKIMSTPGDIKETMQFLTE